MFFDWDDEVTVVMPIIDWGAGYFLYVPPSTDGVTLADIPRLAYAGAADTDIEAIAGTPHSIYDGVADL